MNKPMAENIFDKFSLLGISNDHARIYIELWSKGSMSVVQLSRQLPMGRNKIYRLLKELRKLNLINKIEKQNSAKYEALHYDNLRLIVDRKEKEHKKALEGLDGILTELPYLKTANAVSSKVIHYHGLDGLKQVNWNLVHTKDMYRVYEISQLTNYLDTDFTEKLGAEWVRRGISSRDLTNATEIEPYTNITTFTKQRSEYRSIDPNILKIETEIYIYNDVLTVMQYDDLEYNPDSIFCVEIHNAALTKFQQQIYDILWEQATPLDVVDERGGRFIEKAD